MLTIDTPPTGYSPEKAAKIIAEMAISDPDWTYTIDADPSGRSPWVHIAITDEDGEDVGFL